MSTITLNPVKLEDVALNGAALFQRQELVKARLFETATTLFVADLPDDVEIAHDAPTIEIPANHYLVVNMDTSRARTVAKDEFERSFGKLAVLAEGTLAPYQSKYEPFPALRLTENMEFEGLDGEIVQAEAGDVVVQTSASVGELELEDGQEKTTYSLVRARDLSRGAARVALLADGNAVKVGEITSSAMETLEALQKLIDKGGVQTSTVQAHLADMTATTQAMRYRGANGGYVNLDQVGFLEIAIANFGRKQAIDAKRARELANAPDTPALPAPAAAPAYFAAPRQNNVGPVLIMTNVNGAPMLVEQVQDGPDLDKRVAETLEKYNGPAPAQPPVGALRPAEVPTAILRAAGGAFDVRFQRMAKTMFFSNDQARLGMETLFVDKIGTQTPLQDIQVVTASPHDTGFTRFQEWARATGLRRDDGTNTLRPTGLNGEYEIELYTVANADVLFVKTDMNGGMRWAFAYPHSPFLEQAAQVEQKVEGEGVVRRLGANGKAVARDAEALAPAGQLAYHAEPDELNGPNP